jgi:hypothetical protein
MHLTTNNQLDNCIMIINTILDFSATEGDIRSNDSEFVANNNITGK